MTESNDPPAAQDSRTEDDWREVRRAFQLYFQPWDLRLPPSLAAKAGVIAGRGWHVRWRTGGLRGRVHLDFYASHRMTNERHVRAWQDGRLSSLPAGCEFICFPAGCSLTQEKTIRERYTRRNARLGWLIAAKFPEPFATESEV